MRLLLDDNLSPRLIDILSAAGWDVVHTASMGLRAASDQVVLEAARTDSRVLVSADTDFGTLLATSHAPHPSVVLVRRAAGRRVEDQQSAGAGHVVLARGGAPATRQAMRRFRARSGAHGRTSTFPTAPSSTATCAATTSSSS